MNIDHVFGILDLVILFLGVLHYAVIQVPYEQKVVRLGRNQLSIFLLLLLDICFMLVIIFKRFDILKRIKKEYIKIKEHIIILLINASPSNKIRNYTTKTNGKM